MDIQLHIGFIIVLVKADFYSLKKMSGDIESSSIN